MPGGEPERAIGLAFEVGEPLEQREWTFTYEFDPQYTRGQRGDDVAQRVSPFVARVVDGGRVEVDIRARRLVVEADRIVEVVVADDGLLPPQHFGEGMELGQVQEPAGLQGGDDHVGPPFDVR